jgi:fermentation-respiration switch protein FrsA (DUF1100 family)
MQLASLATWSLAAAISLYLLAITGLFFWQRKLLFRPSRTFGAPEETGIFGMVPVREDEKLLGWFAPPPSESAPVLVFFHGNRGTLARVARKIAAWQVPEIGIFAATYRGYEGNPGQPSEDGLYADGRAILGWLAKVGIPARRIILYGESLGTGIVTQLAIEQSFRAVALEAPFSSMIDIAAERYPVIPCRWLLLDRFDSLSKIGNIMAPLLILHGDADLTIPLAHARKLARAAPSAQLVVVAGATHLNLHERGGIPPLLAFINKALSETPTSLSPDIPIFPSQ